MRIQKAKGFTLIEILIVMLIIGVVFAMITLTGLSSRAQELKLKDLGYKVYTDFLIAQDLAKLHNTHYAGILSTQGYQLYRFEVHEDHSFAWVLVDQPKKFSRITFPENIKISFPKISKPQWLALMKPVPDIIFYNDGTLTPFKLSLFIDSSQGISIQIIGNKDGEIEITTPDHVKSNQD